MKTKFISKSPVVLTLAAFLTLALGLAASSCGDEDQPKTTRTSTRSRTITTTATTGPPPSQLQGIVLDPNLQSATGTPNAEEMKVLIGLQAGVPYPVMVPTSLPGGYVLEKDFIGVSGPTPGDPVGYYSYRYSDPGNPNRILTFNQSLANARELPGYYLTEVNINGIDFQVYWHQSLDYPSTQAPVRTVSVGKAESFVVVWKGSYTDAAGQAHELFYSLSTGSWTGHEWGDISYILAGLKPLGSVGG